VSCRQESGHDLLTGVDGPEPQLVDHEHITILDRCLFDFEVRVLFVRISCILLFLVPLLRPGSLLFVNRELDRLDGTSPKTTAECRSWRLRPDLLRKLVEHLVIILLVCRLQRRVSELIESAAIVEGRIEGEILPQNPRFERVQLGHVLRHRPCPAMFEASLDDIPPLDNADVCVEM